MKWIIAGIVIGSLAGAAATGGGRAATNDEDADPSTLVYEIDRYGIMLEKTVELGRTRSGRRAAPRESAQTLMAELQSAVLQYNYARFENCSQGYLPKLSCGIPWTPAWLEEPAAGVKSRDVVIARASEVSDHVQPYWDAACAEAEKRLEHDEWMPYCSIE